MATVLDEGQRAKILPPDVQRMMSLLRAEGTEARVVGGAVRDTLLGRNVGDIDLAANAPPERVAEILEKAGIKTVPTGITHGTITAVLDRKGYEITTLRRDIETDGRHAKVAFTDDWREDAARRDFTLNALYVDAEGTLYDYFGGADDARAGRVRFIGDARARIAEDVLRILRFFRFYAFFGKGAPDTKGLAACHEQASLIPTLSVERIARETLKLLTAENPLPALRLMAESGVTAFFLPEAANVARLEKLLETEKKYDAEPQALTRLAALLPEDEKVAVAIAARLKFSNRDAETLAALAKLPGILRENQAPAGIRRAVYRHGAEHCRAAMLLNGGRIAESIALAVSWKIPVFLIKGEDVVRLGIPPGPKVGEILRAVEEWWMAGDFKADRRACLKQASVYGKNP